MTLLNPEQYRDSLRELHPDVWVRGKRVERVADEPLLQPGVNAIAFTYELALNPELASVMLSTLPTGEQVNRLVALDTSADDLLRKLEMCRLLCRSTGCAQRYLTHDALGALAQTTKLIDMELQTDYHDRFQAYLAMVQQWDLTCAIALTDPKGDRSKRPHQQQDPDLYLHVAERRRDGIIVRGAKANITGAPYTHEILVLPTRSMQEADQDYALSFAVPIDAPGLRIIAKPAGRPGDAEAPFSSRYGQCTALVVFQDVFIPWERVFLCGEYRYAGTLAEAFANHHRHSCVGCRAGLGDMIIGGAAALASDNGLPHEQVGHIHTAMADLIRIVEGFYATGVAASVYGRRTVAGTFEPDPVYANLGKLLLAQQVYDLFRLAHEIAGGIVVNAPTPEDVASPENAALIAKYLVGRPGVPASQRIEMARFLQDLTASDEAGWYALISAHGGGSPEALRLSAVRNYDIAERQQLARRLACFAKSEEGCSGCGSCSTCAD